MAPAPSSGAARPLTLTTYAQHYAWMKDASGSLGQSSDAFWKVQDVTVCQTVPGNSAPVCDNSASAPKTVTTYEYGAAGSEANGLPPKITGTPFFDATKHVN